MSLKKKRPRKSLRTLLMLWFLLFSIAPLAFVTGYSLVKYEQAIDQELNQRLVANHREIGIIIDEFEQNMTSQSNQLAKDKSFIFHLSQVSTDKLRNLSKQFLRSHYAHRLWVFRKDGQLAVALYKNENGDIRRQRNFENGAITLDQKFLSQFENKDRVTNFFFREIKDSEGRVTGQSLDLSTFVKVNSSSDRTVGYVEEVISLDEGFREAIKNRLNLELFFFSQDSRKVFSNNKDLRLYSPEFFLKQDEKSGNGYFELTVQGVPYGFTISSVTWGDQKLFVGIGASKENAKSVLKNVNYAFFVVVGAIILLLIFLSIVTSKILLRPLYNLIDAIGTMDVNKGRIQLETKNDTELGLLTDSFNEMSTRVHDSQEELRGKVKELEKANLDLKEAQTKLVHAAKMASLGQLVAGVAHELNNPIGFIYSNMSHLSDYSQKLIHIIEVAESQPKNLKKQKEDSDFEYIKSDLPKLIKSCEDGARRTRDIVLGLRTFSRLDESEMKMANIHDCIETTLRLLTGEFKNRISINKSFGEIPETYCNPGQLNQVFMNILSNAVQAIDGDGEIKIETKKVAQNIKISIKDSGKGMPAQTVNQIFDPFFTTKTVGKGTGLGLSISYGIVQNHGGDIQVKSEPKKGTEFNITLPIQSSNQ